VLELPHEVGFVIEANDVTHRDRATEPIAACGHRQPIARVEAQRELAGARAPRAAVSVHRRGMREDDRNDRCT
jgi:hypothetical protein